MGVLDNRHALITGGGTGIGAAIARALAGEGAAVSLAGRRKTPLEDVAASLAKATAIVADVTKRGRLPRHGECGTQGARSDRYCRRQCWSCRQCACRKDRSLPLAKHD